MDVAEVKRKISPILWTYGVTRASVFGSTARGDATPESDVDLLITPGKPMGLIAFVRIKRELEEVLGVPVDGMTEQNLNRYLRPYIVNDLTAVYEG